MSFYRALAGSMLVSWFAIAGGRANAAAVFADTVLVRGPEFLTKLELPPLDSPGTYKVTATDLKWLDTPLEALSFGIFTSTQAIKSMQGPGTFEFYRAGSDKLFLQVYAKTVGPRYAGLVSVYVENEQAPVPLPASIVLLASAIGGAASIGGMRRLRNRLGAGRILPRVGTLWRVSRCLLFDAPREAGLLGV